LNDNAQSIEELGGIPIKLEKIVKSALVIN